MKFVLNRSESILSKEGITKIEARDDPTGIRNAKYVGDLCVRNFNGGWENEQVAIFYQPDVSKVVTQKGSTPSNYFSIRIVYPGNIFIGNGLSAVQDPINAIMYPDGEIIFSRFRHDFRRGEGKDNTTAIDGGRDYIRIIGDGPYTPVTLVIRDDKWFVNQGKMIPEREITAFIP